MTMRVMVIGGGVAGAAAAIALRGIGADVTVYETNPDPAGAIGSFLSLAVNGLRGLERLGCLTTIQDAGIEVERQRLWSGTGKLLGDVPRGRLSGDTLHSVTLRRGDLVDRLRQQAQQAGARIVTGHRLVEATETERGVRARFSTGAETTDGQSFVEAEGDLLLGADGIWSTTRRIIDPAAPSPTYAGLYSVSGVAEGVSIDPGVFNIVFARAGAFLHLAADDGRVWWSAQVSDPVAPDLGAVELSSLSTLFRSEEVPAAILRAATSLQRPTLEHVLAPVPTWHTARTALLGDAAHPVGAGQGASMAIEDAVVLAARLTGASTLEAGLADYVQARQARTAKMIKTASANREAKTAGPIGRRVRDVVMPIVLRHFYERATGWLYTDPGFTVTSDRVRPAADAPPGPGRR
jgi:2-polyprenyl-6-methoxyphenol hydroxylase-like FAD-dependent oxidoreductase